jgi:hypothetical protein
MNEIKVQRQEGLDWRPLYAHGCADAYRLPHGACEHLGIVRVRRLRNATVFNGTVAPDFFQFDTRWQGQMTHGEFTVTPSGVWMELGAELAHNLIFPC